MTPNDSRAHPDDVPAEALHASHDGTVDVTGTPPKYHVDFDAKSLKKQKFTAGFVAPTAGVLFRLFGRYQVLGDEHIPPSGQPAIFVAYHASYLDPILIGLTLWCRGRLPHYLAKSPLFTGVLGAGLKAIGQIPVLRDSVHAGGSLVYARAALEGGQSIVIYPQGTLTKDPDLWPQASKSGAARLALSTGAPLIPVAHWGLDKSMPVGAKIPKPRPQDTLRIAFGPAIDYSDLDGLTTANIRTLTNRVTSHIAAELAVLRGEEMPERFRADYRPAAGRTEGDTA